MGGQPGQIDFENRLSIALLKHRHQYPEIPILLEDESKLIGRCGLPLTMWEKMQSSPLILLEEPIEERINIGLKQYVMDNLSQRISVHGEDAGFSKFSDDLFQCLYRIRSRLGGERYQALHSHLVDAVNQHKTSHTIEGYRPLISDLLQNYYDPMYDYQLSKKNRFNYFSR